MGNSGSSKKKLDVSNTPANEGRKKKTQQLPPLPTPKPQETEKSDEKSSDGAGKDDAQTSEGKADKEDEKREMVEDLKRSRIEQKPSESQDENVIRVVAEETSKLNESAEMDVTVQVKVENENVTSEDDRLLKISKLGQCMDTVAVAKQHIVNFNHAAAKVAANGKMPIDLYYLTPSAPCRATLMTARALGIDLNLKVCNIMEGEHMKEEYMKLNPQSTIPTMDDNGFIIWESRPIMAYFVNQYGKDDSLYPKNPKDRALVDQRLYFDMGTLYQTHCEYYFPMLLHSIPFDPNNLKKLEKSVNVFNTMLEGKKFAAVDHLTIADISLVVTVSNLEAFDFDLNPYPNVKSWFSRTKEALAPYGYEEINQTGANIMGTTLKSKLA